MNDFVLRNQGGSSMSYYGKRRMAYILCIALLILCLNPMVGKDTTLDTTVAYAADATPVITLLPGDFYMLENSSKIEDGKMITITDADLTVGLGHTSGSIPSDAKITWEPYDEDVIQVTWSSKYSANIKAVGPGYSELAAIIQYGGMDYRVDCQIYVPLKLDSASKNVSKDSEKLGMIGGLLFGDFLDNRGLQLKGTFDGSEFTHYLIKLKHVNYNTGVTNHTKADEGIDITSKKPAITWLSSDESVVKVDENGIVTAVGAGYATITVTTTTTYLGKYDTLTIPVMVSPLGKVSGTTTSMTKSLKFTAKSSNFFIETNARKSSSLIWSIYTDSLLKEDSKIDIETTDLLKMTTSDYSGNVSFSGVKAGKYWIVGMPSEDYAVTNEKVNKLLIEVTVPIFFGDDKLTMNVGDYYNILDNTNIPTKN